MSDDDAPRRKPGKPPYKPTDKQRGMVEALVGYGLPHEQICLLLPNPYSGRPITLKTLYKHFRVELDTGKPKANVQVIESLFRKATAREMTSASVTAAIFWLKTQCGWKEPRDADPDQAAAELAAKMFMAMNNMRTPFVPGPVTNGFDEEEGRAH